MTEIEKRKWFPLTRASPHFPGNPHGATLGRWALQGVGPNRVKLKTWKVGGRRYTSQEAIDEFVAQLSGEAEVAATHGRERAASLARDEQELDADGVG